MYIFSTPAWISKYKHEYGSVDEVPVQVFEDINKKLDAKTSSTPKVTIAIAAWNEEVNILTCISSLADTSSTVPFEIVVVNNNSTDKTQVTLDKLHIRSFSNLYRAVGPPGKWDRKMPEANTYSLQMLTVFTRADGWIKCWRSSPGPELFAYMAVILYS
ncbi:glycosyltransferase [Niabella defluvii]|nr:glycosyltransferase [Niabella sp. I65]